VEGDTVDADVRAHTLDRRVHRVFVGDIELGMIEGVHVRIVEFAEDRGAEKALRARDENAHQCRSASASALTTAACWSAVSSP
jgi:hypothetical protein